MTERVALSFDRSSVADTAVMRSTVGVLPRFEVPPLDDDVRALAVRGWEDRARAEYDGLMSMRFFHGLLIDLNAPSDLQELAVVMMVQEQHHTALCVSAAVALGGSGELSFDVDELRRTRSSRELDEELLRVVLGLFCVGEPLALALLRHTLRAVPKSSFRQVHQRIAPDEALHAWVGRGMLAEMRRETWCAWPGDAVVAERFAAVLDWARARDVIEPDEVAAFEDPVRAAQLLSVGLPAPVPLLAAYRRAVNRMARAGHPVGLTTRRGHES